MLAHASDVVSLKSKDAVMSPGEPAKLLGIHRGYNIIMVKLSCVQVFEDV